MPDTTTWTKPSKDVLADLQASVMEQNEILHNRRWKVRNASEAMQPQPPIEYLVDGLISRGSVSIFYGTPGSKKTYSLLHLGACVANGTSWLGMSTNKARVLIVDEESGEIRLARRLREIMLGEVLDPDLPFQYVCLAGFRLDDDKDPVLLESLITETKAELVIFDALADLMSGDENSKQDTQPVLTSLRRIAERTGAALVVIHHSNKNGDYRGSSAIKGAVDTMIHVTSEDGTNRIDFKSEKNRDGELIKFAATASWEGDQFYLNRADSTSLSNQSQSEKYVLDYLTENGNAPLDKITASADICSPRSAKAAVYKLANNGAIYRTNPHAGIGVKAIYGLSS